MTPVVALGELAVKARQSSPDRLDRDTFTYVDISAIDRTAKRIIDAQSMSVKEAPSRARQLIHAGDVLVSTVRPNLNAVAQVTDRYDGEIASTGFCVIRPAVSRLDSSYLFYFVQTDRFISHLVSRSTGAGYPAVTDEDVMDAPIPLPPLAEQQRIAGLLRRADRLRRLRRYALDVSAGYLQAVFVEMFGDPVRNPMGWRIDSLGKHLSFVTSGPRGWAEYYAPVGDRFIRSVDVRMNTISDEEMVFVTPPDSPDARRTLARVGDVLLTITGSRIGRVAPVISIGGATYVSQHVAILRLKDSMRPDFVSMFLSMEEGGQREIAAFQYGQTKPGLNLEQIKGFSVPCPPVYLQEQFAAVASRHRSLRSQQSEALRQAEHLFQALLRRAFAF